MSAIGSCPEKQLPSLNYGKPTFVQPTAQGQLLGSIGKGRCGGKGVESGHQSVTEDRQGCISILSKPNRYSPPSPPLERLGGEKLNQGKF